MKSIYKVYQFKTFGWGIKSWTGEKWKIERYYIGTCGGGAPIDWQYLFKWQASFKCKLLQFMDFYNKHCI